MQRSKSPRKDQNYRRRNDYRKKGGSNSKDSSRTSSKSNNVQKGSYAKQFLSTERFAPRNNFGRPPTDISNIAPHQLKTSSSKIQPEPRNDSSGPQRQQKESPNPRRLQQSHQVNVESSKNNITRILPEQAPEETLSLLPDPVTGLSPEAVRFFTNDHARHVRKELQNQYGHLFTTDWAKEDVQVIVEYVGDTLQGLTYHILPLGKSIVRRPQRDFQNPQTKTVLDTAIPLRSLMMLQPAEGLKQWRDILAAKRTLLSAYPGLLEPHLARTHTSSQAPAPQEPKANNPGPFNHPQS